MIFARTLMFLFLSLSTLPALAHAAEAFPRVQANPSYYDFGSVKAPSSRSMTIQFMNLSNDDIRFFNATCTGDLSVFTCFSSCGYLRGHGVCFVHVNFNPRSADDQRKSVQVMGWGGGASATSFVQGTDAR